VVASAVEPVAPVELVPDAVAAVVAELSPHAPSPMDANRRTAGRTPPRSIEDRFIAPTYRNHASDGAPAASSTRESAVAIVSPGHEPCDTAAQIDGSGAT
jgi:hypothetical protein